MEQRIGQQHDVLGINFLNERNQAGRRVLKLLTDKFHLFSGMFGASDNILDTIESGVYFERRILATYQQCYRLSHPLGEYVLATAKALATPVAHVVFDVRQHPTHLLLDV